MCVCVCAGHSHIQWCRQLSDAISYRSCHPDPMTTLIMLLVCSFTKAQFMKNIETHTHSWKHDLHTVPSVSLNSWLSALTERHGWNFPESIIYVAKRFSVLGGQFSNLTNSEMSWSKKPTLSPPLQAPFWVTSPGHHCNSWLKWKDAINMR